MIEIMEIKNKKIVVAGMGKTGLDTAVFLAKRGADVFVTESSASEEVKKTATGLEAKGIKTETGGHTEKFMEGAAMLVPSPGVPDNSLPIRNAENKKIPVISEIELAFAFSPTEKIIAITGTNGKTTTTSLTGAILKEAGIPAAVCGNIGNTFIGEFDKLAPDTHVVLEISSFQLEKTKKFKPFIACLLNIAEDHFDRHFSMRNYTDAKKKIFANQAGDDFAILNYDDFYCMNIAKTLKSKTLFFSRGEISGKGIYLEGKTVFSKLNGSREIIEIDKTRLWGKGNSENIMASVLIGLLCGVEDDTIRKAVYGFTPLPHRMEKAAEINGVFFINDSKSTNPHSVINALESIEEKNNAVLIMGGKNKDISFVSVIPYFKNKVKLLVLLGEAKEFLHEEFKNCGIPLKLAGSMKETVSISFQNASAGDIVLFSPGCASFDMFKNYKERGDVFKKEVDSLR
ncbi:MAG: UDP-N-acetylmuramoyl-L-alanine--D-glutamate ligase [Candidatus Omnitrophica bacterium]|nr:UDP-N-acetylmuramoyl-L-alanine--D-glutamate ligase [Candidatus Omnitrophota bacterium]